MLCFGPGRAGLDRTMLRRALPVFFFLLLFFDACRSRTTSRRAAPKITGGADIDAGAVPRDTQTACMAVSASMMAAQMKALQMHGAPAALEPMLRDLFLW